MADDDIDDVGDITGEDWLRGLYGSGVTPNVQFGTDSPGSGSEFVGPMGIIPTTDNTTTLSALITDPENTTNSPTDCDNFGEVSVYEGTNGFGQPVYRCRGISALFGGGLYDTWLGKYLEDLDTQDIDRVFREEEAQAFQEILEGLEDGTKTWRDLAEFELDFLADIPEMVDYYDRLLERVTYDGLLQDMEKAEDPEDWQTIFDEYGAAGIEENSYISENGLGFINPQQVLDRLILGDADWGVTVQMCSSTVTTNCVDPKAINDIWEDFGRHIQVIFKGLEIPGLPDWLPLPGIMRLPTIGEIWDTITGPFNEAARDQLNECMAGEDGVVGTNPKTGVNDDKLASVCYEERDIAGILTQGILNGAGDIVDATTDAVGGMVDKVLEGVDCVLNPKDCAGKIKDVIDGILGGADPTQPGLPDWMRVIIIGSQYGDDILKELEDLFGSDINGDGTIGLVPEEHECWDGSIVDDPSKCPPKQFDCTTIGKFNPASGASSEADCVEPCQYNPEISSESPECIAPEFGYCEDGVTEKADAEGTNCEEYAPDGYCEDGVTKKDNPEGTNCEEYEPPLSVEEQLCNEQGRVFNDITGECEETCANSEHVVKADGYCGPPEVVTQCEDPNRNKNEDGSCAPTCTDGSPAPASGLCPEPVTPCENNATLESGCEQCSDGSLPSEHENGDCSQPKIATPTPQQGDPCKTEDGLDGTLQPVQSLGFGPSPASPELECVPNEPDDGGDDTGGGEELWDGKCTSPRPDGGASFLGQAEYRRWNEQCAATHCPSGVPKIDEFDDCSGEYTPTPTVNCDQQNRVTRDDGSCGECKPGFTPDPQGFDQCIQAPPECNDCSCAEYAAANPIECTECPEGESYCEATGQCETAENCPSGDDGGNDGGASIGGGGGGGMLTGQPLDLSFDIAGDPTLLARTEFPITDYLAGIFTNSNGGRNV